MQRIVLNYPVTLNLPTCHPLPCSYNYALYAHEGHYPSERYHMELYKRLCLEILQHFFLSNPSLLSYDPPPPLLKIGFCIFGFPVDLRTNY